MQQRKKRLSISLFVTDFKDVDVTTDHYCSELYEAKTRIKNSLFFSGLDSPYRPELKELLEQVEKNIQEIAYPEEYEPPLLKDVLNYRRS